MRLDRQDGKRGGVAENAAPLVFERVRRRRTRSKCSLGSLSGRLFPVIGRCGTGEERERPLVGRGGRGNPELRKPTEAEEGYGPDAAAGTRAHTVEDTARGSQGGAGGLGPRVGVVRARGAP